MSCLSRRAWLEEAQAEQRQAFLDDLQVGDARPGVVSSVVNFGAFVDLGGMDGLVHVSELSYQHVNHPSEVVKVGDEVQVRVLEVDRGSANASLFRSNRRWRIPWESFARQFSVGDNVSGVVTKTVPFGAFVSVGDGVEGLIHVSEIAMHRVESPELELSLGQPVEVKMTEMDDQHRRVSLSIKQALPGYQERPATEQAAPRRRPPERHEFERETESTEETESAFNVDSSLEAILQELEERHRPPIVIETGGPSGRPDSKASVRYWPVVVFRRTSASQDCWLCEESPSLIRPHSSISRVRKWMNIRGDRFGC